MCRVTGQGIVDSSHRQPLYVKVESRTHGTCGQKIKLYTKIPLMRGSSLFAYLFAYLSHPVTVCFPWRNMAVSSPWQWVLPGLLWDWGVMSFEHFPYVCIYSCINVCICSCITTNSTLFQTETLQSTSFSAHRLIFKFSKMYRFYFRCNINISPVL